MVEVAVGDLQPLTLEDRGDLVGVGLLVLDPGNSSERDLVMVVQGSVSNQSQDRQELFNKERPEDILKELLAVLVEPGSNKHPPGENMLKELLAVPGFNKCRLEDISTERSSHQIDLVKEQRAAKSWYEQTFSQ